MVIFIIYFIIWIIAGFELGYSLKLYLDYKKEKIKLLSVPTIEENEEEEKDKWDIVYILKNDIDDDIEELRYSLRSLKNFTYNKVWFAGGQSQKLKPDKALSITQKGNTKWERVCYTLKQICENQEISENFWLFNDDFFVMAPNKQYNAYTDGDLAFRILNLEDTCRKRTGYSLLLRQCLFLLKENNLSTVIFS